MRSQRTGLTTPIRTQADAAGRDLRLAIRGDFTLKLRKEEAETFWYHKMEVSERGPVGAPGAVNFQCRCRSRNSHLAPHTCFQ